MTELELFTAALGLVWPWKVASVEFKPVGERKQLHIIITHESRAMFNYEGEDYSVYDHRERSWRHLNFFQHQTFLHARVPRVKLADGTVKQVAVPWAPPGSGFTLLFEDEVIKLAQGGMSNSAVAAKLNVGYKSVMRVISQRVSRALTNQPLRRVHQLGIDETSRSKGHSYITVLTDRKAQKVVGLALGKDSKAVGQALIDMEVRNADRKQVKVVTSDLSPAYIKAKGDYFKQADLVFDRFHLAQLFSRGIDTVRRREQKKQAEGLKRTRFLWLKSQNKLTDEQKEQVAQLSEEYHDLGEIYRFKHLFKGLMDHATIDRKVGPLKALIKQMSNHQLPELAKIGKTFTRHWDGIKTYFKWLASNGYAERVNLKIQEIKRVAKGYRNPHNFMLMIYFHLGRLNLLTHTK